jgi:DNA invertase Pin-like site-specific DNA recombinase
MSRIGRSTSDVLDFLAHAAERQITVRIDKSGLTIGDDMPSKIISTVLALAAEIERDFLRSRTREGIANARANGKQIGRPHGPAKRHRLDEYRTQIAELIAKQLPKASICKLLPCTRRELATHLKRTPKAST